MKKRIIAVAGLLVTLSLMVCLANNILKRKDSYNQYKIFYEKSSDIDVLFFGASVAQYSIYPMQLWHDYGITSYNMANSSEKLPMTYYDILNSLDHANPKLIVVDLCALNWAGNTRDNTLKDHFFLDALPISANKVKEVDELFTKDEKWEYLIPFTLYHSRWNELEQRDFQLFKRDTQYGSTINSGIEPSLRPTPEMYDESHDTDVTIEFDTLRKMVELCNDRNIPIVFTYIPYAQRGGDQKLREMAGQMCEQLNVPYYDFLYDIELDWSRDFIEGMHLNYFGGQKLTDFYGKFFTENYNLPDHRGDLLASSWNSDYALYTDFIDEFLAFAKPDYDAAEGNLPEESSSKKNE